MMNGVICMPLRKNVPAGHEDWKLVTCPICGAECWESELSRQVMRIEPDLVAACSECAITGRTQT